MATASLLVAMLSLAAAIVAWGVAVVDGAAALKGAHAAGRPGSAGTRLLLVAWPFAVRRNAGGETGEATRSSKALVAFFAALTLWVAATSAYTNLTMKRPSPAPAETRPAAPGPAPSKS